MSFIYMYLQNAAAVALLTSSPDFQTCIVEPE